MQSFQGQNQMGDLYSRMIWKAVESKAAVVFVKKLHKYQGHSAGGDTHGRSSDADADAKDTAALCTSG